MHMEVVPGTINSLVTSLQLLIVFPGIANSTLRILTRVAAEVIDGSDITIKHMFDVNISMKLAKLEFLTSML